MRNPRNSILFNYDNYNDFTLIKCDDASKNITGFELISIFNRLSEFLPQISAVN